MVLASIVLAVDIAVMEESIVGDTVLGSGCFDGVPTLVIVEPFVSAVKVVSSVGENEGPSEAAPVVGTAEIAANSSKISVKRNEAAERKIN